MGLEEVWKVVSEFPKYRVSSLGYVQHQDKKRDLTCFVNNTGVPYVSLTFNGKTYSRSLALLVAQTFLGKPRYPTFDTPINLNGDRLDNTIQNLMWRPRWFATIYHRQFSNGIRGFKTPVEITQTGEQFPNSWEAAIKYGLLDIDILVDTMNGNPVWPTGQFFMPLDRSLVSDRPKQTRFIPHII